MSSLLANPFGVERWTLKAVIEESATVRQTALTLPSGLSRLFDRLNDFVEIGPLTGVEFGMEQFAIGANFEGAASRWNQGKRFDTLAQFENFGRQTDGLRRVVSNDAVFD